MIKDVLALEGLVVDIVGDLHHLVWHFDHVDGSKVVLHWLNVEHIVLFKTDVFKLLPPGQDIQGLALPHFQTQKFSYASESSENRRH